MKGLSYSAASFLIGLIVGVSAVISFRAGNQHQVIVNAPHTRNAVFSYSQRHDWLVKNHGVIRTSLKSKIQSQY